MVRAGGYVLRVPAPRRGVLLAHGLGRGWADRQLPIVAEPVPSFSHSRRAPLVVFAMFDESHITHIADGRRGASAGTNLVRLNMSDLEELAHPIAVTGLLDAVPNRLRRHVERAFTNGGTIPPKSLGAVVDRMLEVAPTLQTRLARYSDQRRKLIGDLSTDERENLALQKESLGIALEIAGLPRDELLHWTPTGDERQSFLDGLPEARVREDVMLLRDFSNVPGFKAIAEASHIGAKTFANEDDPQNRLTVIMANRLPLEQQTGADLIYYNEQFKAFVMVQYKAMEGDVDNLAFRWKAGDQFDHEVGRMHGLLAEIRKIAPNTDPDGYRFCENPFFLKFCPRVIFNPDDKGLFKGIYLPLDLWAMAAAAGRFLGPKGGSLITYENAGRRINNTEFVGLVANAWVGTTITQSTVLEKVVREVLSTGKTVTFAIKTIVPKEVAEDDDLAGLI
jgi:hypothetical protein